MRKLLILITVLAAIGCSGGDPTDDVLLDVIRVGVLPDQAPDNLRARHNPLLDYLEDATDIRYELVIPKDYADLLTQFEANNVDLAWFGGLTFVQAELHQEAVPLVLRDIDVQFTSCYLAGSPGTRSSVDQFEGATFGFGPELSTSGHLMPRYFLSQQGLVPEEFFASVRHSVGHDQTAELVADGTIELGVANCVIVRSLLESGQLDHKAIEIIETTPPYSDYVWATQTAMNDATRNAILSAFLALDATVPEHAEVLRTQGANVYLPAGSEDFAAIRTAAAQAGYLEHEQQR
ncbi:MAG: phosphate/phosphite/phosphonate ABC transporter substrate-binding protein [Woeseiaceae bacterium]|nr:phosphate/phosphite/phosphonate ABC transporter substrate-binding protein [Woeseiaceae bacterium]